MKRFGPEDYEEAAAILLDESILPEVIDDGAGDYEQMLWKFLRDPAFYFLSPDPNSLFIYNQMNAIAWQIHANVLPGSRGQGHLLFIQTLKYMFTETPCLKVIAFVPAYNERAIKMGLKCGFTTEGVIRKSWKKKGRIYDQKVFGLTKEDFLWLG